jgi:hypothetical protein
MTDLEKAFNKFKNKYYTAVQTDTLLGECDNDGDKYFSLERNAKQFWKDSDQAEKEFLELIRN